MKDDDIVQIYGSNVTANPMPHWKDFGMGHVGSPNKIEFDTIEPYENKILELYEIRNQKHLSDAETIELFKKEGVDPSPHPMLNPEHSYAMGTEIIIHCQKILNKIFKDPVDVWARRMNKAVKLEGPLNVIDAIKIDEDYLAFIRFSLTDDPWLVRIMETGKIEMDQPYVENKSVLDYLYDAFRDENYEDMNVDITLEAVKDEK
jgi:hypothetical protein